MATNFNNFCEEVKKEMVNILPESFKEAEIVMHEVQKNNMNLTGLTLRKPGCNVSPTVYLETFYEKNMSVKETCENIICIFTKNDSTPLDGFDFNTLNIYENVKAMMGMKLINKEMNAEKLKGMPYLTYAEDLAITFCIILPFATDENGIGSIAVTNQFIEKWGVTADDLFADAMANVKDDYLLEDMDAMMARMLGEEIEPMPVNRDTKMAIVSNKAKMNGATVVTNPEVLQHIADAVEGSYYILPSSIHECIVIPENPEVDADTLNTMVQEVNKNEVAPDEILSNHAYYYDAEAKVVRAA